MALIKCEACGKEISTEASACPGCGDPTRRGKDTSKEEEQKHRSNLQGAGCLMIILAFILGLTVVGLPFAMILGLVGLVVLVMGLFS